MRDPRTLAAVARTRHCAAVALTAALLVIASGCGDDSDGSTMAPAATTTASTTTVPDPGPRIEEAPDRPPGQDGGKLCSLLDPSFMDELELPVTRGACAERLTGSIGFADPRGTPVWKRTILSGVESALLRKGARVQLSVAIVTEFEDRDQDSVESDIAYLEPVRGGYVLAKAPGSLWRAVGKPDVPPTVITPPPGF